MGMCICLTALAWRLLVPGALHTAEMPLTVSNLVTGAPGHVRITNTSAQPVTAWSLGVTTTPEAGRTHREVYTADVYLSEVTHGLPGSSERLERLLPGDSRELPLDPLPPGATVDVVAAVLDDGTAVGDEQVLAPIFARRVKERDAFRAVVETFNDVLAATRGTAALDALRERLTALAQRDESIPCRAALDAVQTYTRSGNPTEIDQALRTYAAFVTREYELAVKHSRRKA
jgi:hypothetical protein